SPWYSLVIILPLAALYQLLAWLVNFGSDTELRNGADVLLRTALELFGLGAPKIMGALVLAAMAGVWLWQRHAHDDEPLEAGVLALMVAESIFWAGLLLGALLAADTLLLTNRADTVLQMALLSIGAGIYEEAVFRLVLISLLMLFFTQALLWHKIPSALLAVAGAGVIFSLFHYVGPMGEPFSWNTMAYRSVAGVLLGGLFIWRGFGITAYTHTVYDLFVLGLMTVHS
ncbi:MAG: CPBP family intramembrane metalloprotease, partial [Candidatus Marinimicrobia bacterium]|nr:CPBP family intramembrane metalloprotease [Candidatus Neomarinimicrobiota bacterium]